jgi:hypothetical protein
LKGFHKYLAFIVLLAVGCDGDEPQSSVDYGLNYFPLQTGSYIIYDVGEIRYSQLHEPETLAYELLSEIVDSFPNAVGGFTYVVHNSKRFGTTEWEYFETLSFMVDDNYAVVTENGTPYVKLSFPLEEGRVWNGNKRNTLGIDEYKALVVDAPIEINGLAFPKATFIEQEMYDDEITRTDKRIEIYAKGVGLISKEITQLTYCTEEVCLSDRIIENGIIYNQKIKEYGKN